MIRPSASHLRVLDCEVDVFRRVVTRAHGGGGRLTHKALQVLLAMAARHGEVVSREALFGAVWPDTMPTDDVLTQAITQLRKAFADDRDAPRYIETIPKVGYRLLAPVQWRQPATTDMSAASVGPAPAHAASATPASTVSDSVHAESPNGPSEPSEPSAAPAPGSTRDTDAASGHPAASAGAVVSTRPRPWGGSRRAWAIAAAALVLAACSIASAVWALRVGETPAAPAPAPVLELDYRALTSTPGAERLPALSPDGATVAFVQAGADGSSLMLQPMAQGAARALTTPAAGRSDAMPVWSRDGLRIAFVRVEQGACRFMLVAATGGEPHAIGPCLDGAWSQFDWTPDGRGLVMGGIRRPGMRSAPLHRLDLATGQWRPLAYAIGEGDVDQLPRYSPDGRLLVFRRNVSLADLWVMPAEGGTPRPLTRLRGDIRGWDWLPDSSGLVLSHVAGPASLWLLRLADGVLQPLSRLPAGDVVYPDIAAAAWSMVFEIDHSRSGLFRTRIDDEGAVVEPVFASSGADMLPAISPDGRTLAFVSSRSMSIQLWLGEVGQPDTLRAVAGLQPVTRHPPAWSADGRWLLVLARTPQGDRLVEVEAASGRVQPLPLPATRPVFASYAGDPARLLVGVDDGRGRVRLVLYAREGWRELAVEDDVALARYDATGDSVLWTRPAAPGVWRADPMLRGARRIADGQPAPPYYRHWAVHAGQAYSIAPAAGCAAPWRPLAADAAARCLSRDAAVVGGSPALDARGGWMYFGLPMSQNVDVGAAPLPRIAAEQAAHGGAATMAKVTPAVARSMTFGCRYARCRQEFVVVS